MACGTSTRIDRESDKKFYEEINREIDETEAMRACTPNEEFDFVGEVNVEMEVDDHNENNCNKCGKTILKHKCFICYKFLCIFDFQSL